MEATEEARREAEGPAEAERRRQVAEEAADRQRYDLKRSTCKFDEFGFPLTATGTITNRSSTTRSYAITVEFLDRRDRRVGEGFDYVTALDPGKSARWEAIAFAEGARKYGEASVEVT